MLHLIHHAHRLVWITPLAAACLATSAVAATPVSHATREIATAKVHANVATQIDTVAGAQLHLHHVINCLVGPHGNGYDAAAEARSENHCDDLGNGAIADSAHAPALQRDARAALRAAQAGLAAQSLDAVHRDANQALAALNRATQAEPAKP